MSVSPGISRRALLGRAGAAGATLALGGGAFAAGRLSAEDAPASPEVVAFHGVHQAGVTTAVQDRLHFVAFDLLTPTRAAVRDLMRAWSDAAARLTAGRSLGASDDALAPPTDTGEAGELQPARLTVTFGFGPGLFAAAGLRSRRPAPLIDIPHFPLDDLDEARGGGDLCVQVCADDPQVAFHAVRNLARIGRGAVATRWSQTGFQSRTRDASTPRNLMGFRDGSNNLDPTDRATMDRQVWVGAGDEPRWMSGGTYLVARRVDIRVEAWDRTPLSEQEQLIGRHKVSGAPIGARNEHDQVDAARLDPTAHVRIARPQAAGDAGERMLRRGYNFAGGVDPSLAQLEAGLFFLAFQRDPRRQFVPVQTRLAANDGLNEYIVHRASAIFAIPPGVPAGGYVGQTLLG